MAKLKGPLFSLAAHGALGKELTYSKRQSGATCRNQKKQPYANTAAQQPVNTFFDESRAAWATLSDTDKADWATFNNS